MPPSSSNSNTDGYDLVLRLLLGVLAVVVPLSHLAWLSGNLTAHLTGATWAAYQPTAALLHPEQVWPATRGTPLLIGARIVPVLLCLALGAAAGILWGRYKNRSGGRKKITDMAKARDIEPLMAKAITDKARSLRPSLKDAKHIAAKDTGILLGNLQGSRHEVRMGFEDVAVAIMAPGLARPHQSPSPPCSARPDQSSSHRTRPQVTPSPPLTRPERRRGRCGPWTRSRSPTLPARCGGTPGHRHHP